MKRRARLPAALLGLLRVTRLIGPAFRGYERWQTWRSPRRDQAALGHDGLPLPPQRLVVLVAGPASVDSFLRKGRIGADVVRGALARQGVDVGTLEDLLDFGVGCGRVARHWHDLAGPRVHGCDVNPELVAWTRANLPFVDARLTGVAPPLPYDDAALDAVYAFSVLTHLPEPLQRAWSEELARVIRPGGHLIASTHGRAYFDRLDARERAAFEAGEPVVHFEELPGANLCSAFHAPELVARQFAAGFEVVEFLPEGARGNGRQDLYVLRRRGSAHETVPGLAASVGRGALGLLDASRLLVPDEVVARLEQLAARDATSVSAVAIRELADVTRRVDNPALLGALPAHRAGAAEIVADLDADRLAR